MKLCFLLADTAESKAALAIIRKMKTELPADAELQLSICLLSAGAVNIFSEEVQTELQALGNIAIHSVAKFQEQGIDIGHGDLGADSRAQSLNSDQLNEWLKPLADTDVVFSGAVTRAQQQLCSYMRSQQDCEVISYVDAFHPGAENQAQLQEVDLLWVPTMAVFDALKDRLPEEQRVLARQMAVTGHPDTDTFATQVDLGRKSREEWFEKLDLPENKKIIGYLGSYGKGYQENFRAFIQLVKELPPEEYHIIISAHPSALNEGLEAKIIAENGLQQEVTIIDMTTKRAGLSSDKVCGLCDMVVSPGGSTMEEQLTLTVPNLPLWVVKAADDQAVSWRLHAKPESALIAPAPEIIANALQIEHTNTHTTNGSDAASARKRSAPQLLAGSSSTMAKWLLTYAKQHHVIQQKAFKSQVAMDLAANELDLPNSNHAIHSETDAYLQEHLNRHSLWRKAQRNSSEKSPSAPRAAAEQNNEDDMTSSSTHKP